MSSGRYSQDFPPPRLSCYTVNVLIPMYAKFTGPLLPNSDSEQIHVYLPFPTILGEVSPIFCSNSAAVVAVDTTNLHRPPPIGIAFKSIQSSIFLWIHLGNMKMCTKIYYTPCISFIWRRRSLSLNKKSLYTRRQCLLRPSECTPGLQHSHHRYRNLPHTCCKEFLECILAMGQLRPQQSH